MFDWFTDNIWLVPCYSLLGTVFSLAWSPGIIRHLGPRPAGYINVVTTLVALFHSLLALPAVWQQPPHYASFTWLEAADLTISLDLNISGTAVGALVVIAGLNLLSQIYAIGYLEMDWGWARFFALLALFEAGMSTLVLTNSLFFSYVMLEILTLGTYLLIGFWFNQSLVVTGARDAFLTKRVGDLILLMAVVAVLPLAGTWNYDGLHAWAAEQPLSGWVAFWLALGLLVGPVGKCALLPLHLWLDEAMEGPMPATVLRNSVVVPMGLWVLYKCQPILNLSPAVVNIEIALGAATAIGCGLIALAQVDVKRVFSYATSAYMGLMFVCIGAGVGEWALHFVAIYAIAMALLLFSVGGVVLTNVTQDLTQLGGLWSKRPVSGICYLTGAATLVALPPLGGFWGLVPLVDRLPLSFNLVVYGLNALTALSLARVFGQIFLGKGTLMALRSPEGLWPLVIPPTFLAGIALHLPMIWQTLGLMPAGDALIQPEALALVGSSLTGAIAGLWLYGNEAITKPITLPVREVQDFFTYDFYTAKLYKLTVIALVDAVARVFAWLDRVLVDGAVNSVGLLAVLGGQTLRYNVSGQSQFYILSMVLGIALLGITLVYPLLVSLS